MTELPPVRAEGVPDVRCVALSGGVGGARLSHGLDRVLPAGHLAVVVNTADDFDHLGLRICPDLDTVMYTLADRAAEPQGWGVAGDTFAAMEALDRLGGPTWFRLGDRDLATHLWRSERLRAGERLTEVTRRMARALGVGSSLLPMCEEPVSTAVRVPGGVIDFQEYFVRHSHGDEVLGVEFRGLSAARPTPEVLRALADADLVIFCPSNPFVSLAPILEVPGMRPALRSCKARKVAVSPILGGRAIKGPAAAMMRSLGHEVSALGVARLVAGDVDAFVLDEVDADLAPAVRALGLAPLVIPSLMRDVAARETLARRILVEALGTPPAR